LIGFRLVGAVQRGSGREKRADKREQPYMRCVFYCFGFSIIFACFACLFFVFSPLLELLTNITLQHSVIRQ